MDVVLFTKFQGIWTVRGPAKLLTPGADVQASRSDGQQIVVRIKAVLWTDGRDAIASYRRTR